MKKSFLKFLLLVITIIVGIFILALIGISLLQIDIIQLEKIALKNRLTINIISWILYGLLAFIYVPKLINQKITDKAHLKEKITPKKIKVWSWYFFLGFIVFDVISFQIPFYFTIGG